MYYAFAQEYPSPAADLNTHVEIFPVSSAAPDRGTAVYAIWDTGASQTVITHSLMIRLGLIPIETELVHGINSKQVVDVVVISIKLPNGLLIPDVRVFVFDIPPRYAYWHGYNQAGGFSHFQHRGPYPF
jgi:hypothetical protein